MCELNKLHLEQVVYKQTKFSNAFKPSSALNTLEVDDGQVLTLLLVVYSIHNPICKFFCYYKKIAFIDISIKWHVLKFGIMCLLSY